MPGRPRTMARKVDRLLQRLYAVQHDLESLMPAVPRARRSAIPAETPAPAVRRAVSTLAKTPRERYTVPRRGWKTCGAIWTFA